MNIKLTGISLRAFFVGLGVVIVLASEGFSQAKWEKVLADAQKEGKVEVWGPPGALIRQNVVAAFGKAFPKIELEWQGIRPASQAAKLQTERQGGLFS